MKVANLNRDLLTMGWVVNKLPLRYQRDIPGLAATFFIKGTFQLQSNAQSIPWPDKPLLPSGDQPVPKGGVRYSSDFVPYKEHGEWALVGKAHGPPVATTSYTVSVKIGETKKELLIHGERQWVTSMLGESPGLAAGPAGPVELSYAEAWGGPKEALNPSGCGAETERLPRIELPGMPVVSRQGSTPGGVAPIPPAWPQRHSRLGHYDGNWLKERWPWFPEDFDVHYFQGSPASQWIDGFWRGDEEIELHHLLKDQPHFQSALPGLKGFCYLERKEAPPGSALEEVPLMLDTIWIDADQMQLALVWRGRTATRNVKLHDISAVMVDLVPLDEEPPAPELIREKFEAALYPRKVLLPSPAADTDPAAEVALALLQTQKEMHELRAEAFGALAAQQQLHQPAEDRMLEVANNALNEAKSRSPAPVAQRLTPSSMEDLDEAWAATMKSQGLSPTKASELFQLTPEPDEIEKASEAKLAGLEAKSEALSKQFAPPFVRADFLHANGTPDIEKMWRLGCREIDLSGLDFSGLTVRDIDFRGARLCGARFRQSVLAGSDFTGADLTGADLSGAILKNAILIETDLRHCAVEETQWQEAILVGAILSQLDLSSSDFTRVNALQADFNRCRMDRAILQEALLIGADFSGASLVAADFTKANLEFADLRGVRASGSRFFDAEMPHFRGGDGADFSGAFFDRVNGRQSIWEKSNLSAATFEQANLESARFNEALAVDGNFYLANMTNVVLDDGVYANSMFKGANMLRATFDRADLTNANLDYTNLYQAGLWETILQSATWRHAYIKGTKLDF